MVDGDLVGLGEPLRLHDAPRELVDLESLEERGLVADGALPEAAFAVGLEVGLEVEALQVLALVAAGGQRHSAERQRTAQRDLRRVEKCHLLRCKDRDYIPEMQNRVQQKTNPVRKCNGRMRI